MSLRRTFCLLSDGVSLLHLFASLLLCAHVYCILIQEKFPVKLFSFTYFSVSVVRQWNENKIVTETQLTSCHFLAISKILLYTAKVLILEERRHFDKITTHIT